MVGAWAHRTDRRISIPFGDRMWHGTHNAGTSLPADHFVGKHGSAPTSTRKTVPISMGSHGGAVAATHGPAALSIADQGIASATNFLTSVIIARACGEEELAAPGGASPRTPAVAGGTTRRCDRRRG